MCQPAALLFRADVDLHDARAHRRRDSNRKAAYKDLLRRSLRLAKPFRAGSHSLSDCSEPPSLGAGLPFYRLTIRCSREPLRFTSVLRLNPADCQPLSSSSFISQQQHIYASRELLFLGAVGCGKLKAATSPSSLVRAVDQCNRLERKFSGSSESSQQVIFPAYVSAGNERRMESRRAAIRSCDRSASAFSGSLTVH